MTSPRFLAVKNYERFQHYHATTRPPVWIKFYNALLDDYAFIQLSDAARSHLMLLWLLASRHNNRIPYDAKYIASALHTRSKVDVDSLVRAGFVTIVEDDSSTSSEERSRKTLEKAESRSRKSLEHSESASSKTLPSRAPARSREEKRGEETREEKDPGASAGGDSGEPATKGADTWLTPFADAWQERYDGILPAKPSVAPLRSLVKAHGADEVLRRWRIYLARTEGTYASASRFAATWGDHAIAAVDGTGAKAPSPALLRVVAPILERYRAAGLIVNPLSKQAGERIAKELVAAGAYPSYEAAVAEIRLVRPWDLVNLSDDAALRLMAERLGPVIAGGARMAS